MKNAEINETMMPETSSPAMQIKKTFLRSDCASHANVIAKVTTVIANIGHRNSIGRNGTIARPMRDATRA